MYAGSLRVFLLEHRTEAEVDEQYARQCLYVAAGSECRVIGRGR